MRARRRLLSVLVCAGLTLAMVVFAPPPSAHAAPTTPFAVRQTFNDNGAIALVGNTLLTCPTAAAGCTAAKSANSGGNEVNNNNYVMTNLDVDSNPSTFDSSNSQLVLASGSSVLWAGLYWGARLTAGTGGANAPTTPPRSQMLLRGPNDSGYRTIGASVDFGPNGTDQAYQEFADVTSIVQPQGAGVWWGANVAAATGQDRYAGWTLVVVYRNSALPLRNLTVFDGFNSVSSGSPQTITISGFLAPLAGPVQTQLGMVAYEGDLGITGDSATLTSGSQTTTLATGLSPGNNFFSSANSLNGQNVTTRNPSDRNMLGFDIKNFGAPNTIPNGQTSARITLDSSGDQYYPGVVTTAIDLFAPDFTSSAKTVTDLNGSSPAGPGDTLQYTVNLVNSGSDPANSSVLTDVLPPNTTYLPGSLVVANGPGAGPKTDTAGDDQAEFIASSRTVRFRLGTGANATAGGTIAVNAATTATFQVTVDPPAAGTTVSNQATLAYVAATIGKPFSYVTNPAAIPVVANADLSVTKSTTPDPVIAGQLSTSTITVRNSGPNAAINAQATDVLPPGGVFVSATPSVGSCAQATGTVSCSLGNLANGAVATIIVQLRVPANSTDSTITDVASVSSDTNDPNQQNNTAGATTTVGTSADLVVTKTATPATVAPGETITFPITVHNNGPSDAQSVNVADPLPSSLSVVSVDRTDVCQTSPSGFTCSLASLAAGGSFVVNVVAQVPPDFTGTSVSNTATAQAQTSDPVPGNNSDTATVAVTGPVADVAITKSADSASVDAGGRVTYTLTVSNPNGPSIATGVVVTDALPVGLTAVSAVSDLGTCQLGPPISCNIGTLFAGGAATVTISANVSPDTPLQPITNTASVTTTSADPDPTNNSASATTAVSGSADVAITKTGTGSPVAGGPIAYTLTVSNNGPSRARGVTITDTLPATLTTISAPGCSITGSTVTCTVAELAVNGTATFTIQATVIPTFPGGNITNTATVVTTGTTDPDPSNNSATFTSTAGAAADLSISKTAPAAANAGATISYNLTVANAGPSAAATSTVTDQLPAGLTAVSATTDQGSCVLGPPVSCSLGTVNVGATVHITIVAGVDPSVASGTVITNTASVASTTLDPTGSNNTDTAATTIDTAADVSVTKTLLTPTSPPLAPGQPLQFQILVHNNGPSDASSVSLRDSLSVNGTTTSLTVNGTPTLNNCDLSSGDLVCPIGDLAAGGTTTVLMTVTTDPGAALGSYTNAATVAALTPDPQLANNSSTAPFDLARLSADVSITKTGDAQLVAGTPFNYTLTVDNTTGPSNAQDVVVTDTLPPGLTATQASATQGSCTIAGSTVTCALGTVLASTQPVTISLTGTVNSNALPGPISNTATVTSSTADPDPTNNTASFDSTIGTQADLSLAKTPDTDPLVAGTSVGYTLTVTNAGPSDATPVTLIDVLPGALAFDPTSSDPTCTQTTTVNCALGTIRAGTTRIVRVSGQLDSAYAAAALTNTATVSSPVQDPDPTNNAATADSNVIQQADLSVTKLADAITPAAGSDLTYAISVINNGPSDAVNASFNDALPLPPIAFVLPSQGDVTCTLTGLQLRCSVPRLAAGESRTGQITVHLPADQPPGPFANTASVTSDTPDPIPTNNASTASVNVVLSADLTITKTVLTNPVVAGAPVTYRLDVINNGPSIAPDALISDTLSPEVSFTSASAGCMLTQAEQNQAIVACALGTLAVGASASATITVTPSASATGNLTNSASVGARALDPDPAGNTASVTSPITTEADVAITVSGPAVVDAGGTTVFHFDYANLGPSNATNVLITATFPAGLTPQALPGCTVTGQTVTCSLANLAAGMHGTIDVPVTIDAAATSGSTLQVTATISADQTDVNPENNAASAPTTVARVTDVGVTVAADMPTVEPGGVASYTVTVTNHGPLTANAVTLTNVLPAQVTNPSDPPFCAFTGNTATCLLGTMAVGATIAITFRGSVPATVLDGTKLTDRATVTQSETDSQPANNNDSATITVVALVVAVAPPPPVQPTPTPTSSEELAFSGENLQPLIQTAGILIALGVGLALAGRYRRRRRTPTG